MLHAENHKTARQSEVSMLKLFQLIKWLCAENVVGRTNQMTLCWKVTIRAESVIKTACAESVVKTARAENVDCKK